MKKEIILLLTISLFFLRCKKESEQPNPTGTVENPNILLIIADDVGIDAIAGYDVGTVKPNMPNLNKLASNGLIFDNVWAYPLCCLLYTSPSPRDS